MTRHCPRWMAPAAVWAAAAVVLFCPSRASSLTVVDGNVALKDAPEAVQKAVRSWREVGDKGLPLERALFSVYSDGTGEKSHWLVTGDGAGMTGVYRQTETVLFSPAGEQIAFFPGGNGSEWAALYGEGVFQALPGGEFLLAFSVPRVKDNTGVVEIVISTPERRQGRILTTKPGPEKPMSRAYFEEAMIYLYDADGDGLSDVVINRRTHTRQPDGTYQYRNQKLVNRLSTDRRSLEPLPLDAAALVKVVAACKKDRAVPHIAQEGIPRPAEDNPALGEAIFPEEETWRAVKYGDTLPPSPPAYVPDGKGTPKPAAREEEGKAEAPEPDKQSGHVPGPAAGGNAGNRKAWIWTVGAAGAALAGGAVLYLGLAALREKRALHDPSANETH